RLDVVRATLHKRRQRDDHRSTVGVGRYQKRNGSVSDELTRQRKRGRRRQQISGARRCRRACSAIGSDVGNRDRTARGRYCGSECHVRNGKIRQVAEFEHNARKRTRASGHCCSVESAVGSLDKRRLRKFATWEAAKGIQDGQIAGERRRKDLATAMKAATTRGSIQQAVLPLN